MSSVPPERINEAGGLQGTAQNLGASGWRLFIKVVFPLSMPGYVAGASNNPFDPLVPLN